MADNHPKRSRNPNQLANAILQALNSGCRSALSNTKRCPKRAASKSDSLTDALAFTFTGRTFVPGRRLHSEQMDSSRALEAAKAVARVERDKIE